MNKSTTQAGLPLYHCPKFDRCNVNKCPLHPDYDTLQNLPGEPSTCRLSKAKRIAIASEYPGALPRGGLTTREWSATPSDKRPVTQKIGANPAYMEHETDGRV